MKTLVRQLGLQSLCGIEGDNCLCFVNGAELTNEREAAVEDAAFVSCWMLPLANNAAIETVSVGDTVSLQSGESVANGHNAAEVAECPVEVIGPSSDVA